MREIKFRAWDKKLNEWVHKAGCNILGETILLCGWMQRLNGKHVKLEELNDIEVMQYTGLKDKNGIEIYEGDIVAVNDDGFLISEVFYFGCMFAYRDNVCEQPLDILCENSKYSCEVIGNIYENKELLQ